MTSPRDDLLYTGAGNALGRAIELAAVPLLCALAGRWLDDQIGTRPVLTVVLIFAAVVGGAARMYYGYRADTDTDD